MARLMRAMVAAAIVGGLTGCAAAPAPATKDESSLPVAGARRPEFFRQPGPRGGQTIFSRIDMPAPNSMRTASGIPGPDYWQQRVNYKIDADLDAEKKSISGREVITYVNNSPDDLPYLWLHLEQNLFKEDSLGALSIEPGTRFGFHGFSGGFTIKSVKSVASESEGGGQDLKLSVYDTVGRLELPAPVKAKGGRVEFQIEWSFNIPPYGADRMGIDPCAQGDVFEIAQWFPAACVYDDVYGWNTLPYLGQGEFYTNFGD
jgi:hypothetical protein